MTSSPKPLASLCVLCYNQEKYIALSIRAALAQTYEPLEIIISDDASTDRSFEIIKQVIAEYRGPHKVIINRNPTNFNLPRNFQKACSLSSGELIIKADGDDISYPNRVEALMTDWLAHDKKALVMASRYDRMDENGKVFEKSVLGGAVLGWDNRTPEALLIDGGGGVLPRRHNGNSTDCTRLFLAHTAHLRNG